MRKEQAREWAAAQNIRVSIDLVEAAKNQLKFLAAVDRNRHLYEGPALEKAIYRYNAFWLPLLAKHLENPISKDPIVVPLDCEWIWHCHRLNPLKYRSDCLELFGKILDNENIISSVEGSSKSRTEELWNQIYPEEPYELDYSQPLLENVLKYNPQTEKFTHYDLVSAIKRQTPFGYQVSRPYMSDEQFLEEAVGRYKGFLHLIRTTKKKSIKSFTVPTYDIDLIWHSHQLHPVAYFNDLCELFNMMLGHDDTDSDRSKGGKLLTGFSETTQQFEQTFGLRYWKAGAMYRGTAPTPVTKIPYRFTYNTLKNCDNLIQFPEKKSVEVLLEFVEIKNLPECYKENLHISFTKKQRDNLFTVKKIMRILPKSREKQVAHFECEPSGEFLFELICQSPSSTPLPKSLLKLGSCTLSLQECLASRSQLYINKWIKVISKNGIITTDSILLNVSLSFTRPTIAVQTFHMVQPKPLLDESGIDVLNLKTRQFIKGTRTTSDLLRETHYIGNFGEKYTVTKLQGNEWFINSAQGSYKLSRTSRIDGHLFELFGHKMVKLFSGRRLEYESKHSEYHSSHQGFMTAVEFSVDFPYGRSVALFDFNQRTFKVKDGWMVHIATILVYILSDILKREGGFTYVRGKCAPYEVSTTKKFVGFGGGCGSGCDVINSGGGCGSGCDVINYGGGCGTGCDVINSGGGCGSGCDVINSGGGCGSGCDVINSGGGCGSGCDVINSGGGCDNGCDVINSGGGCGSGCDVINSGGGCGSGCDVINSGGGCGSGCDVINSGGGCGSGCNVINSGGLSPVNLLMLSL